MGVVRKEACKVSERVCRNNFTREGPGRENGPQRSQNRPLRQYKEERRSVKFANLLCSYVSSLQKLCRSLVFFLHTSGRVHGAAVSGVDTNRSIVSVEWFEKGETKGKEVSQPGTEPSFQTHKCALIRIYTCTHNPRLNWSRYTA